MPLACTTSRSGRLRPASSPSSIRRPRSFSGHVAADAPESPAALFAAAVASIKSLVTLTGSTSGRPSMRHSISTTARVAMPEENAWSAVTTRTFCGGTYS